MCKKEHAVVLFVLLIALAAWADSPDDPEGIPTVDGVLGLETADGHGWLAIKVDFADEYALNGILWYNNDVNTVYPTVSVGTGFMTGPGSITDCVPVAESIFGDTDSWSSCTFSQPIAASLGGLFVVMEFPVGEGFTARGLGGGPAVGYCANFTEPHGWISGDGETWHPLAGDFGFAMLPTLIPYTEGMLVKSMGAIDEETPEIPSEYYSKVGPNPFNPKVVVRFGLPKVGHTKVEIFDIRGRRVARLLNEELAAGHHEVTWQGLDSSGRKVASGAYFMRIVSGDMDRVQRVTMVK